MDNQKFEKLIDLIINENEEQARELFHEIVVEKSREIYESILNDEMNEEQGMVGEVGQLADEITSEETGEDMSEADDDDMEGMDDIEDEVIDIDSDEMGDGDEPATKDDIEDIKDKLDELMAEFEQIMGGGDDMDDMDGMDDMEDMGDEEGEEELSEEADDEEDMAESLEEAIQLKKVSVTHGDNGANTKSVALTKPKVVSTGANPVKFSGHDEAVPTSPKGPSNAYSKGETQVKGAGSFKNAPAQNNADLEKAPAAKHGDDGSNTKSPVAESKKSVKKVIR